MTKPNIVLLHTHDLGQQVQPYGYPHRTPDPTWIERLPEGHYKSRMKR